MADAAATRGPGGSLDFPPVQTLPQPTLDRLSAAEREIVMLLALAGPGGIAPRLLAELAAISESMDNPLDWLTKQGLVTSGERDVRLVSGVADRLGPKLRPAPADAERLSSVLTSWVGSPKTAPRAVADHAVLINAVIDTATATGHQGRAARLAKAASPAMAISLRYDAWGRRKRILPTKRECSTSLPVHLRKQFPRYYTPPPSGTIWARRTWPRMPVATLIVSARAPRAVR